MFMLSRVYVAQHYPVVHLQGVVLAFKRKSPFFETHCRLDDLRI